MRQALQLHQSADLCPAEQVQMPEKTRKGQEKMRMGEGMRVGKGGEWEREERGEGRSVGDRWVKGVRE